MTLEHSDFQDLFEKLMRIIERYQDDPVAMEAISTELENLYKKIPIYPGIIAMSLDDIVTPAKISELEEGSRITVLLKNDKLVSGEVTGFESGKLKLKNCRQFEKPEELDEATISEEDVREVRKLVRDTLAKSWPSLDFEVED